MALTIDELNATTEEFWEPGAQDVWYHGNVLIGTMLKQAKKWDGGTYIRQVLDYGQPLGSDFNAASVFNSNKVETMTAARWSPAYYYEPVVYDIDDQVMNAGDAQKIDIVFTKLTKAQKHIRYNLAYDLYHSNGYGDSGRKLVGLPGMISTSLTYGGIAVADLTEWVAGSADTTATPIAFNIVEDLLTACQVGDDMGDIPDLLITTRSLFSSLRMQTLPHLRLTHGDLADMGFVNIDYNGIPIVSDYMCPTGYLYAINRNYMGFRVHTKFNFKREPWEKAQFQMKFFCALIVVLQMICKRRDAHGSHSGLTA